MKPPLNCPHCGFFIEDKNAKACPQCGADEKTAWGDLSFHPMDEIPTGWSKDDDFSYEEFLDKEFGVPTPANHPLRVKRAIAVLVVLWLMYYFIFR